VGWVGWVSSISRYWQGVARWQRWHSMHLLVRRGGGGRGGGRSARAFARTPHRHGNNCIWVANAMRAYLWGPLCDEDDAFTMLDMVSTEVRSTEFLIDPETFQRLKWRQIKRPQQSSRETRTFLGRAAIHPQACRPLPDNQKILPSCQLACIQCCMHRQQAV